MYWSLARKQVIDDRGQRNPEPNTIWENVLPDWRRRYRRRLLLRWDLCAQEILGSTRRGSGGGVATGTYRGDRFVLREWDVSWRLLEHTGDDLFQRLGALPQPQRKRQVLPRDPSSLTPSFFSFVTMDSAQPSSSPLRGASAERPIVYVVVVVVVFLLLNVARHFLILLPLFRPLAVRIVGCAWPACAVCHAELGAGLGKAGAGVHPEEVIDDEGPRGFFAGRDGVEMVRMFVGGCAERRGAWALLLILRIRV